MKQKTTLPNTKNIERKWYLIDAENQILGRLSTRISLLLMGKRKPLFSRDADLGDFVIVVNASKVSLTGKKWEDKIYYHHSTYPGGLKSIKAKELLNKDPSKLLYLSVKRMLPKNKLGRKMLKRLKVYNGFEHPHRAQSPVKIQPEDIK